MKNAHTIAVWAKKRTFAFCFSHPDYNRRYRIYTDSAFRLVDFAACRITTGEELHLALKRSSIQFSERLLVCVFRILCVLDYQIIVVKL